MGKIKRVKEKLNKENLSERFGQIKWIYEYAKPHTVMIIVYLLLGLSGTVVSLLSSLVSRDLVDIITGHKAGKLIYTFAMTFVITIVSTTIGQISSLISTKINLKVSNYIKADVFDKIMSSEWEELNQYSSGDLIARWSGDVSSVANGILSLIPNFCIYIFHFASALYMVCKYDASFAIFALASVPISMLISREAMKRMQKNNMNMLEVNSKISGFNQEAFGNIQLLKCFDLLSVYNKKLKALQTEYTKVQMHFQKVAIKNAIVLTIVSMLVTYSAQGWGIYKVWIGAISYGTMTMFLSLSTSLSGTVNNLLALFPSAIGMTNSAKRLMMITSLPKEDYSQREEVKQFYEKHQNDGIGIAISDMRYAYNDGEDIFNRALFEAMPRESVAIVGPSGEGKTTMLRYLLALVKGQEGCGVIFSGVGSYREEMKLTPSVRQLMSYVPQGNTMFSGTIADNMRNGREDATDEEIIQALKTACAWSFVEKLPDGINTDVRDRGSRFSEGQVQRLSIARAVLRRTPILLLDEATSALDIETEKKVLRNIMSDDCNRTCIISTHRPSILTSCNRIYSIREKQCKELTKEEVSELLRLFQEGI